MTKGEIALELTKHFSNFIRVSDPKDNAQNVIDFYNAVYNGINAEETDRHAKFA